MNQTRHTWAFSPFHFVLDTRNSIVYCSLNYWVRKSVESDELLTWLRKILRVFLRNLTCKSKLSYQILRAWQVLTLNFSREYCKNARKNSPPKRVSTQPVYDRRPGKAMIKESVINYFPKEKNAIGWCSQIVRAVSKYGVSRHDKARQGMAREVKFFFWRVCRAVSKIRRGWHVTYKTQYG